MNLEGRKERPLCEGSGGPRIQNFRLASLFGVFSQTFCPFASLNVVGETLLLMTLDFVPQAFDFFFSALK